MTVPEFWLALAGISAIGLLWVAFCEWLANKWVDYITGEQNKARAANTGSVNQANSKGV